MYSYINVSDISIDSNCEEFLILLYNHFIKHQFDLLGSGFVTVNYKLRANGVHGYRYIDRHMKQFGKNAEKKLKGKCSCLYEPINWFVDYKSGFFFNPPKYNSLKKCNGTIGKIIGVDIKCPWELGRFYHFVQMAVLAVKEEDYRERVIAEFKNELTDFWELNPIGSTVQWSAPMDVSIRIVNLLVSYDILTQIDHKNYLDDSFCYRFEMHIHDCLKYVFEHLEYSHAINSNHYLSNLAGIIFAASYLPASNWTDACMVFGVQELIEQVKRQFYEEGAHFEGSSSYHRLSTEFILYSTALVYGVLKTQRKMAFEDYDNREINRLKSSRVQKYDLKKSDFFPSWYIDRLCNMGIFTRSILKDNNEIVQIGDNDSGRLVKLTPMIRFYDKNNDDNVLDHRTLLSAMSGLYKNNEFEQFGKELPMEYSFIKALSGSKCLYGNVYDSFVSVRGSKQNVRVDYQYKKETIIYKSRQNNNLLDGIKINYFSRFGIVIFRSKRMYLSMVIDTAHSEKLGHTHNDRLSIELMIDGEYITRDPGGYIYTAMPGIRDRFRSVTAHNTIHIAGKEQNDFNGTFGMKRSGRAELLYCCSNNIVAYAEYKNIKHLREIRISDNEIWIIDYSNYPFKVSFHNRLFSTGYGKLMRGIMHDSKQVYRQF